jgi:hypothetical protein
VLEEVVPVQHGVQPVEADRRIGVQGANPLGRAHADPEGRMHRHGQRDQARAAHLTSVQRLHRQVHRLRCEAGALQESEREREAERLVSQLVAGDQQDRARGAERDGRRLRGAQNVLPAGSTSATLAWQSHAMPIRVRLAGSG